MMQLECILMLYVCHKNMHIASLLKTILSYLGLDPMPCKIMWLLFTVHNATATQDVDFSKVIVRSVSVPQSKYNIKIMEEYGLDGRTGFWMMRFTFDYCLETKIEVHLTNTKYSNVMWTMEVAKCRYLGIESRSQLQSFDIADELMNTRELNSIIGSDAFIETKLQYIEHYIIPLVTKKIKYTRFKPQFRLFLSHRWLNKDAVGSLQNGLTFLGYESWLDKNDMPIGAQLQPALKVAIDQHDCFVAWLNEEYMVSDFCRAELLYAKEKGKIIIGFGDHENVKHYFTEKFEFLKGLHIFDPTKSPSFYKVLFRLDNALFDFENLPF